MSYDNYGEHDVSIYEENSMFEERFLYELKDSGFYAKPKKTKIIIKMYDKEMIIGNCIVANIEITNEKIPVYSYNADVYKKYLHGKKIITGSLVLRKTTVAQFIALQMYMDANYSMKSDITDIEEQIEQLSNVVYDSFEDTKKNLVEELLIELRDDKRKLESKIAETEGQEMYFRLREGMENDAMDLLYYSENNLLGNTGGLSIELVYESDTITSMTLNIKDVLFVKKNTEINIGKNDIAEVYQFIGNPS